MNTIKRLSLTTQAVLGGALLYVIFSFLDWQQACAKGGGLEICAGRSEWHGVGIIAGLLVIVLLAWEAVRLLGLKVELGTLQPGLVSVALAGLLLLFTVLTFFVNNEFRHWPQWIGLLLSIAVAGAAYSRARAEGVQVPGVAR